MTTMAELIEAQVDWFDILPPSEHSAFHRFASAEDDLDLEWIAKLSITAHLTGESLLPLSHDGIDHWRRIRDAWPQAPSSDSAFELHSPGGNLRVIYDMFLAELHKLLCSEEEYSEERKKLLDEYRTGQASFAAAVTAALAPHLGGASPYLAAAVAVMLTLIGKAGLRTWCSSRPKYTPHASKSSEDSQEG